MISLGKRWIMYSAARNLKITNDNVNRDADDKNNIITDINNLCYIT